MENKVGLFLVAAVGLVVVLGCSKLTELANTAANSPGSSGKTFTLEGKEWKSYDLDQTDITMDLPGAPKDQSPPPSMLPPGYKEIFSGVHILALDDKDFTASGTELIPTGKGKEKFSIKMLADTSMTAIKRQLPDTSYTLDIKSDTNARINGTFSKGGKSGELRGCVIYKKDKPLRVWMVMSLYSPDNVDAHTAAQRIFDSVVFKGSIENCK